MDITTDFGSVIVGSSPAGREAKRSVRVNKLLYSRAGLESRSISRILGANYEAGSQTLMNTVN